MNKIKQWLSDRRDRKLREKIVFHLTSDIPMSLSAGYAESILRYINTGEDLSDLITEGRVWLSLKEKHPDVYKKCREMNLNADLPAASIHRQKPGNTADRK